MLLQTIKTRVSWHCLLRQSNREKSPMSGNPLFIGICNPSISQPLTSMLRTQRDTSAERGRLVVLFSVHNQMHLVP